MTRLIPTFIIVLLFSMQASAYNFTLSGWVSSADKQAIFGAVISINNQPRTITDATGRLCNFIGI
jgi:hypothetical protein